MILHPYVEPAALLFSLWTIKPHVTHTDAFTIYTQRHASCMQIVTDFLWFVKVCTNTHSTIVYSREIVNSFYGHSSIHTRNTWILEDEKKDNGQIKFFLFLGEKETKIRKVINHIEWQNLPGISFLALFWPKNILFFVYFSSVKVCPWLSYLEKQCTLHS